MIGGHLPRIEYEHVRYREEWRHWTEVRYRWWDLLKWFPYDLRCSESYLVRDDEGDVVKILPVIDCGGMTARELFERYNVKPDKGELHDRAD